MSSTRYAPDDGELRQQRWASDPEFSTSISAILAAKRIGLIADRAMQDLLWFIQWRSLQPRGLRNLAKELINKFPERLGTRTMRRLRLKPGKKLSRDQIVKIRSEFPNGYEDFPLNSDVEEVCEAGLVPVQSHQHAPAFYQSDDFISGICAAAEDLHEHLLRMCVDPGIDGDSSNEQRYAAWLAGAQPYHDGSAAVWYFDDLVGAVNQLRADSGQKIGFVADTEATRHINTALDFCFRRRRMILIEGKAGIGKTETAKAWCSKQGGLARYVEIPSSNDDRSFFAAIAESIGVARGTSYNGQQIKLRVEEALRASGLMLVLDEGQFLWPQYQRPQGIPSRVQWIKTAFDAGTPIALVALPKFSEWQELYARRTLWDDDQLERRLNRKVLLPEAHSEDDLLKIAQARHPEGGKASWKLLVGYAMAAAKKQASAITEALESAADIAHQQGRDSIIYDDIYAAVELDFTPIQKPGRAIKWPATTPDRSRTDCHILLPKEDTGRRSAPPINRLQTANST
jgi:AAA domain